MSMINRWADDWGIDPLAVGDLLHRLGLHESTLPADMGSEASEGRAQSEVRLEGAEKGVRLWRNNVGACIDERGNFIRYGLANDSKKLNAVFKSSDLIGIEPITVVPAMVGQVVGIFTAREIKAPGWVYRGSERERAQKAFIDMVNSQGGNAGFATGRGTL